MNWSGVEFSCVSSVCPVVYSSLGMYPCIDSSACDYNNDDGGNNIIIIIVVII